MVVKDRTEKISQIAIGIPPADASPLEVDRDRSI